MHRSIFAAATKIENLYFPRWLFWNSTVRKKKKLCARSALWISKTASDERRRFWGETVYVSSLTGHYGWIHNKTETHIKVHFNIHSTDFLNILYALTLASQTTIDGANVTIRCSEWNEKFNPAKLRYFGW